MNILIVGCGKVGSSLACMLSRLGHDVSVVDRKEEHFNLLEDDFNGFVLSGVPIDQNILRNAGIEGCEALVAVTEDDNTNAMVCQIAKELFQVPLVLGRIYDPRRRSVFEQFHIKTFCPTNLSVTAVYSMLTDRDQAKYLTFDNTIVSFTTLKVEKEHIGLSVSDIILELEDGEVIFAVIHEDGHLQFVGRHNNPVMQAGDRYVIAKLAE